AHRLHAATTSGPEVSLADGNRASAGELIITRRNDRRLRITATDWVKNGDRWTILNLTRTGGLTVRHTRHGRTVPLPAAYVQPSVELGYATTVHTAQGVTADTMHGVVTGEESRQQLYTMLTRGRIANHLLRFGGRRRGPAHPNPARHNTALHRDRAARTNRCPRRQSKIGQHPAARAARSRRPARRIRRTLPRRPAHGRRRRHRQRCSTGSGDLCQPVGARAIRRAGMADAAQSPNACGRPPRRD